MERTDLEQWKAKEVARLLALLEGERRYYQEILASLPVGLVVLAGDRTVISANRSFRRLFQIRAQDLRGKTIEQILPSPVLVERIREAHLRAEPPASFVVETGEQRLRVAIVPTRNWEEDAEVETLLMIEPWGATEAAPTRGPELATPAPDIPAVLWTADPRTLAFTSVSGAAELILGFPIAHWLSTPPFFHGRIHPEDRATAMQFYQAAIERGGDGSTEFRAVTAAGATVWCRESFRATNRAISGVLTDITLRKQLEQQMLAAGRSESLHTVASRLAHDLNNPLMIITGYGEEVLQAMPPQEAARADLQQIMTATGRISGIASHLLNFTRRVAELPRPVNVTALLAAMQEKISAAAGAPLELNLAADAIWAMADARQFEEVVLAVVGREDVAREGVTQREEVPRTRLSISCSVENIAEQIPGAPLQPGVYACVTVADDSRGTERGASIFEAALSGKNPDLSRAYSLVREWGGDIAFPTETASTFRIYLPPAKPAAEAIRVSKPAEKRTPAILLVDDEAGIRDLVKKILRREQYRVIEAASAEEALNAAAAQEGKIDLLITDVMLPGKSGRELAQSMIEWLPKLKVLYVSGFTDDESVRAGAFPPGAKFLQKPFTLGALVEKVREALS